MRPGERRQDYTALIESLLAPYGAWKAGEGRWRVACPVHRGDNATSFSIFSNGRWHCLAGDTKVTTWDGYQPIRDLVDKTTKTLTVRSNGTPMWVDAVFESYGEAQLWKTVLKRNQQIREVYSTAEHRWFSRPYTTGAFIETTTSELKPGQYLRKGSLPRSGVISHEESDRLGWTVVSTEATDRVEEVFCTTIEETGCFVLEDGLVTGNCFRCKASGDMARLVMVLKHLTLQQAQDFVGSAPQPFVSLENVPQLPGWKERVRKQAYPVLSEATLGPYRRYCSEYLLGRGFSKAALRYYEIGYDLQACHIIIPVRDVKGRLVGMTERLDFDTDKTQYAKYKHSEFQKTLHLYGMHKHAGKEVDRLYLCEGQLDVVRMYQLGLAAVAVMGDSLSVEQVDVLMHHCRAKQVVLAFDADEAGESATRLSARRLWRTVFGRNLAVLQLPAGRKDPGELRETDRLKVVPVYTTKLLLTATTNVVRMFHPHERN